VTAIVGQPDAPRLGLIVHGILGSGRNWRGVARALAERRPDWRFALADLRNHAEGPKPPPPHTIAACGDDLAALVAELGAPELVIGHSFGGKVALSWAERHATAATRSVQVLDCPPGRSDPRGADTLGVIEAVVAAPAPVADRAEIRSFLRARGISEPVVAWLATSLVSGPEGWRWGYDVDGVRAMITDFFGQDFWVFLERPPARRVRFLRAGRSDRWLPDELARFAALPRGSPVSLDTLANAGHWLHVDDPEGTMQWIAQDLT